jgi:hypothetical protein
MHDAMRIVDARPSIQSRKFVPACSMWDVDFRLARNLQRVERSTIAATDESHRKAHALLRFVTTDNRMGPEEQ